MGLVSITTPNDGETADAADLANPLNQIVSEINGNLDSNNLAADAIGTNEVANNAITGAKIQLANDEDLEALNSTGTAKDLLRLGTDNFLRLSQIPRKDITTTSTMENALLEVGFNFIDHDTTEASTKAITFQNTYTSAPFVLISFLGETDGSDPTNMLSTATGISDSVSIVVGAHNVTTTGFTAVVRRSTADTTKRGLFVYLVIGPK